MKNIVILYSGGLDSLLMEKLALREEPEAHVTGLFFDHGQDSLKQEVKNLPLWVKKKHLDWLGDEIKPVCKTTDPFAGAIYIPGRNLVFCVLAACYYQPNEIWMGTLADENNEGATDKNETFIEKTEDTLNYVLSPFLERVKIKFPLADRGWTKTDAVKSLLDTKHLTKAEILKTTSCWFHNGEKPCGKCKQCLKRALVLRNFNIYEEHAGTHPLSNENHFCSSLIEQYQKEEHPNADEFAMQKLIKAFKERKYYWEV